MAPQTAWPDYPQLVAYGLGVDSTARVRQAKAQGEESAGILDWAM
jgi:hypothetical protein